MTTVYVYKVPLRFCEHHHDVDLQLKQPMKLELVHGFSFPFQSVGYIIHEYNNFIFPFSLVLTRQFNKFIHTYSS